MEFIRNNLLQVQIFIVLSLFLTYFFTERTIHPVKRAINGLMLVFVFGVPIFFTSVTRSVFEVNKMLLLRFVSLAVFALWIIKTLLVDYDKEISADNEERPYYFLLGIKWFKTGLEIPILVWLIINVLATIFSSNIYVSIIGAYDRWEGLITVFNYAFLVMLFAKQVDSTKFFYWMFFSFIISASISAVYGIVQSNGIDFMRWSADATKRAFGSINNPVHYGPYVGMMICLALGYMINVSFFKSSMKKWNFHFLYLLSFLLTLITYTAMFLSWGRGTWLGFQGALTFFLLFSNKCFIDTKKFKYYLDFIFTIIIVGLIYILMLFNVYEVLPMIAWAPIVLFSLFYCYMVIKNKSIWNLFDRLLIIALAYIMQIISVSFNHFIVYNLLLFAIYLVHKIHYKKDSVLLSNKLIFLLLICFGYIVAAPTITDFGIMFIYLTILLILYLIKLTPLCNKDSLSDIYISFKTINILAAIILFFISLYFVPNTTIYKSYFGEKKLQLNVLEMAQRKVDSYSSEAIGEKSARMSMWKSGITWGLDNPLIGTGVDTIKELYPKYRRVEYARREGGHNLTPDRLHNEYVNTFATTGFLGFIARYLLVIGLYVYMIVGYLYKNRRKPSFYLIVATFVGFIFYQGQVLFNFGVVATTSFNYMLMGLGLAIGYYNFGNSLSIND
jgi:O-antigen ligase